jgi:hypothetical protein
MCIPSRKKDDCFSVRRGWKLRGIWYSLKCAWCSTSAKGHLNAISYSSDLDCRGLEQVDFVSIEAAQYECSDRHKISR